MSGTGGSGEGERRSGRRNHRPTRRFALIPGIPGKPHPSPDARRSGREGAVRNLVVPHPAL